MGRILAIDYGRRRCGIAVTDPLRLSINPRDPVEPAQLLSQVLELARDGDLDAVVLTRSAHRDGTPNPIQRDIDRFAARLNDALPELELAFEDEFGTSREASDHLRATGVPKGRRSRKGALDSVSAGLILERYLRDRGIW